MSWPFHSLLTYSNQTISVCDYVLSSTFNDAQPFQIKSKGAGSSHAGMGSSGDGWDWMGGLGYGEDYWMGGSGYGGDWMSGGEECCPTKKVWGSINPSRDGIYDLDMASSSGYGEEMHRPRRCGRDQCIYKKRDGTSEDGTDGVRYCFAPSEYGQSMCLRDEGEKPSGYGLGYYAIGSGFYAID